jgi:nucleoside-diphosphate-sugar epimerase
VYAAGKEPHLESDPLDASPERKVSVDGVRALEDAALKTQGVASLVLRYGRLWGPGTWAETPQPPASVHVDAAAHAALLAVTRGEPGIYNIADDDGNVSSARARRELGFDPAFRSSL